MFCFTYELGCQAKDKCVSYNRLVLEINVTILRCFCRVFKLNYITKLRLKKCCCVKGRLPLLTLKDWRLGETGRSSETDVSVLGDFWQKERNFEYWKTKVLKFAENCCDSRVLYEVDFCPDSKVFWDSIVNTLLVRSTFSKPDCLVLLGKSGLFVLDFLLLYIRKILSILFFVTHWRSIYVRDEFREL